MLMMGSCAQAKTTLKNSPSSQRLEVQTQTGNIFFDVEIADTDRKRQLGLMYRKNLNPDAGMLFIFKTDARHAFWMKNTSIPLDILFIDNNGKVVDTKENMAPLSTKIHKPAFPCRYALEMMAGNIQNLGIRIGDSVNGFE